MGPGVFWDIGNQSTKDYYYDRDADLQKGDVRACELWDVEGHHMMESWGPDTYPMHDGSQAFGDSMIDTDLVIAGT